jgi:aminoglycoside phosphotransferase (APT) family kinase protein
VRAVLDWDLAALGPREMDLGWFFGLNSMMDELFGQRVPGFPERAEAVARYEVGSGQAVIDLAWHEVFALVRALAINDRQRRMTAGSRHEAGGSRPEPARDDPLVRILRSRMESAG